MFWKVNEGGCPASKLPLWCLNKLILSFDKTCSKEINNENGEKLNVSVLIKEISVEWRKNEFEKILLPI